MIAGADSYGEVVAGLALAARAAASLIRYKPMGDRNSVANMVAALALQGWEIEPVAGP